MPGLTRCLLFRPALPPPLSSRFWTPCTGKLPKPTHGLLLWKEELSETRRHVTRLEHDLVERRAEIVLLEAAQTRFEGDMERQASREDGKGLSMQDSVVAGDAFVGSTVIDRQIVNDPEAIARAVLDAYRSGRSEA